MKNQLSLSILLVTVCLLLSSSLNAQVSKTVDVATAGTLPTLIKKGEKDQITHLTLTGNLNGDDIRYIREMAGRNAINEKTSGKLSVLDLSQANIVAGGDFYYIMYVSLMDLNLDSINGRDPHYKTSANVIDDYMFQSCSRLREVILPASITSIGMYAFDYCSRLTSVTFGNSLTSIGMNAFGTCERLTSVQIPNNVTTIKESAFRSCSSLTFVTIGSGVTSIGNSAFSNCKRLQEFRVSEDNTYYCQLDGALYSEDKTTLIVCPNTKTNEYIIPNSVTSIGNYAFDGCNKLTSITIPNGVISIGDYAFASCAGLTSITIPKSITSIGNYAFSGCDGLKSITIPNRVTSIGNGAFAHSNGLTSITIPNSVISIGNEAFAYCVGLTSITIPNSVSSIGHEAFSNCGGLTSITIPNSVTSIGEYAFAYCVGLTSIIIPNRVTSIAHGTFAYSKGLTSITIPNSVTSIGSYVFSGFSLLEIHCEALTPPSLGRSEPFTIDSDINDEINAYNTFIKTCKIFVPKGTAAAYKNAGQWKKFSIFIEE